MASLKQVVAKVLQIPAADISDDISPRTIKSWNSLKHIELIMTIEREFGVRFEASEVPALTSLGSVRSVLIDKGQTKSRLDDDT
jgi:acyl carrier protein